jgi:hypothetical protein
MIYISVLTSDLNASEWKAIQEDSSLDSLRNNPNYTASVYKTFSKSVGDQILGDKIVTENSTGVQGTAKIIELGGIPDQYIPPIAEVDYDKIDPHIPHKSKRNLNDLPDTSNP